LSHQEDTKGRNGQGTSVWKKHVRPLIGIGIISLLFGGVFFPLLITGIAQTTMPYQANGDLAQLNGKYVGSYLVDNGFSLPVFFWARNESNPQNASASGVDPDINIGYALSQIPRISNATGISSSALSQVVVNHEQGVYWIFGTPYVDVLQLNLILIHQYPSVYSNFTGTGNITGA
jgi:potassium-transporting ATPase KdpC subunit